MTLHAAVHLPPLNHDSISHVWYGHRLESVINDYKSILFFKTAVVQVFIPGNARGTTFDGLSGQLRIFTINLLALLLLYLT